MLKRIVEKRVIVISALSIITAALLLLYLIFGNSEGKISTLILSLVLPLIIYGFVRLLFRLISVNMSWETLNFFIWFFLVGGVLGFIMQSIHCIRFSADVFSPVQSACAALVWAILDEAKKQLKK